MQTLSKIIGCSISLDSLANVSSLWFEVSFLHMVIFGDELVSSLVYLPDISVHGLVQAVRAAVWDCNSSPSQYYLLLRLPLCAAIKMASFIVQLAQDHVVLEEKLVSHAKSAERNKNMELGLGSCLR